jgi:hypothetical protein
LARLRVPRRTHISASGSIVSKVAAVEVRIAGLDDMIAMQRASGRPMDPRDIADLTAPDPHL